MRDPFDLCETSALRIQSAALRAAADYLDRFPTMIRATQGPAEELLSDALGPLPSEWVPDEIAPALFRVAVAAIMSDPRTLAAVTAGEPARPAALI